MNLPLNSGIPGPITMPTVTPQPMQDDLADLKRDVLLVMRRSLVENIDPLKFMSFLRSKMVLDRRENDEIHHACRRSTQEGSEKFFDVLTTKGSKGYDMFCAALMKDQTQVYIVEALNKKLEQIRDIKKKEFVRDQLSQQHFEQMRRQRFIEQQRQQQLWKQQQFLRQQTEVKPYTPSSHYVTTTTSRQQHQLPSGVRLPSVVASNQITTSNPGLSTERTGPYYIQGIHYPPRYQPPTQLPSVQERKLDRMRSRSPQPMEVYPDMNQTAPQQVCTEEYRHNGNQTGLQQVCTEEYRYNGNQTGLQQMPMNTTGEYPQNGNQVPFNTGEYLHNVYQAAPQQNWNECPGQGINQWNEMGTGYPCNGTGTFNYQYAPSHSLPPVNYPTPSFATTPPNYTTTTLPPSNASSSMPPNFTLPPNFSTPPSLANLPPTPPPDAVNCDEDLDQGQDGRDAEGQLEQVHPDPADIPGGEQGH